VVSNGNISLINHNQFLCTLNLGDKNYNNQFSSENIIARKNSINTNNNIILHQNTNYQQNNLINNNQMKQQYNMQSRPNGNYNRNSNGNYSFTINLNNPSNSNNINNNNLNGNNNLNYQIGNSNNNLNKSNISNEASDNSYNINSYINDSFAHKQQFFINIFEISKFISQSVWRIFILFLDKIKKCEFLFQSTDFTSKIFIFITRMLKDDNLNIPVHQALIEIFPFLIKYGLKSEKDEINRIVQREIFESRSFYKRRLYLTYLQSSLKVFSMSFLIHNHTMENFLKMFDDIKLIQSKCVCMIKEFYPLLINDTKIKPNLANKIEEIKKIIPIDFEIKRVKLILNNFLFVIYLFWNL